MKTYTEIIFDSVEPALSDLLVTELSEIGYEGFLEEEQRLTTYIEQNDFDFEVLSSLASRLSVSFTIGNIPDQNWNALWESSFQPVIITDKLAIRASFHDPVPTVENEIIITPKMSFGTGHHATTYLMVKAMYDMELRGKSVLDFGTGTGILAILAKQRGAHTVLAIDNDEWSIENALENAVCNQVSNITIQLASAPPANQTFDVILANINRHILLQYAGELLTGLNKGGILLLSGILSEDRDIIVDRFSEKLGLPVTEETRNNWMAIRFDS
jgi:ribosomal protein L11 methyltransferase